MKVGDLIKVVRDNSLGIVVWFDLDRVKIHTGELFDHDDVMKVRS
tara:strand:+ start:1483 stop:1617 length:135 start_codon:yes stop_codon:yes gene_type:complete